MVKLQEKLSDATGRMRGSKKLEKNSGVCLTKLLGRIEVAERGNFPM